MIEALDADIIGLQEIDDAAVPVPFFSANNWYSIIDEDSENNQDHALIVRRRFKILSFQSNQLEQHIFDAGDEHSLFPYSSDNRHFPNRREVFCIQIGLRMNSHR